MPLWQFWSCYFTLQQLGFKLENIVVENSANIASNDADILSISDDLGAATDNAANIAINAAEISSV